MSMHAARFSVTHTFPILSRSLFFVLGDTMVGEVRIGMVVDAGTGFREAIHAVEFARTERREEVALGFRYRDAAELATWQSIAWDGMTLEIPAAPILHPCPCCGFRTMADEDRGSYDICPVCNWEDDGVQLENPHHRGGAKSESLTEARAAFAAAHPQFAPR
jgi:hypothetical protein